MRKLVLVMAVVLLGVSAAMSYTLAGYRWPDNAKITMAVNGNFPAPSSFNNAELVRQTLVHVMLDLWNPALQANGIGIRYADGGKTAISDVGCDQTNIITFTDTKVQLPNGVLALASATFAGAAGLYLCGSGPAITTTVPNQVLDADITFNVNYAFSPAGLYINGSPNNQARDIEGTALHEMGHVLGLHHSGIVSAIMVPGVEQEFPKRTLLPDDIAGVSAVYGVNVPGGSMSGKITDSNGAAVAGAHVVLTDSNTGFTTVSILTNSDGAYTIVGIPPSTYNVTVEPLDGPAQLGSTTASNFPAPYAGGNSSFGTTFVSTPVTIVKGSPLTGQNITVPAAKTGNFLTLSVGLFTANNGFGSIGGASVISAPRGRDIMICAEGISLTGEITTSAPASKVTPTASTAVDNTVCNNTLGRKFHIAADAAPGFYDVRVANAAQIGALFVTTSPSVGAGGLVDGAAFGKVSGNAQFAPGSIVSLFGADFGTGNNFVSTFPVPTQLGGISVRFGDRFAPLYYVGTGQINALIPYEVSGTVAVSVLSGNNSIFNYGNITLTGSAPRIFVTDQNTQQGAIQNGSVAGSSAIVDSSFPAKAGDILVIYAEGLGQTANPASVSGISGGGQISGALSVNIGGINATRIDYKGISPGFVGLYQINAQIPAGVASGNAVKLFITDAAGNQSNTVVLAVR